MVRQIMGREHFRLAFETTDHPKPEEIVLFEWLKEKVIEEYGKELVRFDTADKDPYNFEEPPIMVLWQGKYLPLKERSPLTDSLKRIQKHRVYARKDIRDEVKGFCERFWINKRKG